MKLEFVGPTQERTLKLWDDFIMNSPRGHYCQLSTWLRSLTAYGFDFSVLLATEEGSGSIMGGIGLISIGHRAFGVMNSPIGPILDSGFEYAAAPILEATLAYAEKKGSVLFQLQLPCSTQTQVAALLPSVELPMNHRAKTGMVFPAGVAPGQMLWIEFPAGSESDADQLLRRFSTNTRRNIRLAERNELEVYEATTEAELQEAYAIIELNGLEQGYATRSWKDFGRTVIEQIRGRQAIMLVARHRERLLGAHYGVLAGRRYSYLMGGTKRCAEDLRVGHFLHWNAIRKAVGLGLSGYDLTSEGSAGVARFKMGFRPTRIPLVAPRYYVLSRWRAAAFVRAYPFVRRHKQLASRILSAATRLLPAH